MGWRPVKEFRAFRGARVAWPRTMKTWTRLGRSTLVLCLVIAGAAGGTNESRAESPRFGLHAARPWVSADVGSGWNLGFAGSLRLGQSVDLRFLTGSLNFSNNIRTLDLRLEVLLPFTWGEQHVLIGPSLGLMRFSMDGVNGNRFAAYGLAASLPLGSTAERLSWGTDLSILKGRPGDRSLWLLSPGVWVKTAF